jgi:2-(1,2-epoxy-1,2-dihydrophenyl)acetyl-CoA isomerase
MTDSVIYTVEAGVATLVLNRPDVLNALNSELLAAAGEAVKRAAADPAVRAVVLTGAGRGFSAGADLRQPRSADPVKGLLRALLNPLVLSLRALPKPVITAVNGVAAGAGMSLALAGDVVLAGESASFAPAFTKIGLVPDAGGTYFLPRYAGEMRARHLDPRRKDWR